MDLGLAGKTVIVTGGSGGIGRGLVYGYADEGCNVVIAGRDAAKSQEVADACADRAGSVVVIQTDVTDNEQVQALITGTKQRFGPVDVLVNNSGGVFYPRPFEEKPREEWEWELNLNIWGVVNTTRAVAEDMIARKSGCIVNITSNSALLGDAGNQVAHYGGTKGYVMSLSKALAYEWGPHNIRVNCIAPGWIVPWEADHVGEGSFWKKYGYEFFGTPEEMEEKAKSGEMFNVENQPIKRVGRPEDIADLALFLASDRAGFLTGQLVSVSGGSYMP
jgi:NAD(P)-dependent dehydrogenase (short-subunit alcohol dehydrogenase family)